MEYSNFRSAMLKHARALGPCPAALARLLVPSLIFLLAAAVVPVRSIQSYWPSVNTALGPASTLAFLSRYSNIGASIIVIQGSLTFSCYTALMHINHDVRMEVSNPRSDQFTQLRRFSPRRIDHDSRVGWCSLACSRAEGRHSRCISAT
ncbi:hypothetical protein GGI43DRAFT_43281 [Trichoderma evansii]